MRDPKAELVAAWLVKARRDLLAAERLAEGDDPCLDVAIYHCQQAAEKAVKAFLVSCDEEFGKTHDLETLVSLAARRDGRFATWVDIADNLTPYATAYRYPAAVLEPDAEEFGQALSAARAVCGFIFSVLGWQEGR